MTIRALLRLARAELPQAHFHTDHAERFDLDGQTYTTEWPMADDRGWAFFRLGEVIVEAVEVPGELDEPARFWGVTFAVADLDAAVERLGELSATIRDAVQPGRRIAPLRKEAGLGLPVALISD